MTPVHILISLPCRELFRASLLTFKTLRTGFPNNPIFVYGNDLDAEMQKVFGDAARSVGAKFIPIPLTVHGQWIESLLFSERADFWIADGDLVFFDKVDGWFNSASDVLFAGRHEPEFFEPWTKMVHVERLHPSLMWFNTSKLNAAMRGWPGVHPFQRYVERELIRWSFIPRHGQSTIMYDTTAGLFHALGGQPFSGSKNAAFEHLFSSTYFEETPDAERLRVLHELASDNPESVRGLWKKQLEWYWEHRCCQ